MSSNHNKENLNILMFNRWVGYNEGGNETHIKELALFLSQQGHKISILTTGNKALSFLKPHLHKIYQVSSPEGYYSFKKSGLMSVISSLWFLVKSFFIISKIILVDKEPIDILSVHFSLEAFLARFVRLVYGIPYILVLVGDTDFELIEGKYADVAIQISNFMADECVKFGYKPRVLTKGVDRGRFNLNVSREERNTFLKNPQTEKLVITVCRLDPRKNLETFVRAADITSKTNPNIKYLIVGGGTEEEKLRSLVKELNLSDFVFFTGVVPSGSDKLPKYYRAADLFAMPTLYEGFGYVFSEAMACGLPVISTDTSAVPEVVADVGIIIPIKRPDLLAENIIKVLTNDDLYKKLQTAGTNKVEHWYWDNLISEYSTAYKEAANANLSLGNRLKAFIKTFDTTPFLVKKVYDFAVSPSKLKWGPTKS